MRRLLLSFLTIFFLSAPLRAQEPPPGPIVRATLVAEPSAIVPGQAFRVGIFLKAPEGWHTYWENPGDAGMPTQLNWTLPAAFTASDIDWPAPHRMTEGPLVTFSYPGGVFLPVTITPPATLAAPSYPLQVKASWLVCKEVCIPESASLGLTLAVAKNASPSPAAELFREHDRHRLHYVKKPGSYHTVDNRIVLDLPWKAWPWGKTASAVFFPRELNLALYAEAQELTNDDQMHRLSIAKTDSMPSGDISGIMTLTQAGGEQEHYSVVFRPGGAASMAQHPAHASETAIALPLLLLFALLGGLILNLMPCVLPVLSLKALAIAKKSGHAHRAVVRQGLAYTLGILLSFALFAGVLIALRQGGEAIGWGYQMQSPAFVGFLIFLLFLVGLSLSGVFHLPVLLGNASARINDSASLRGSFFTGILATAVATPCTAPFMASAVGAALTLPAPLALLVFETLGLGLALPFLLISLFPALRRFIPKPGAWMESFQRFLAFPMYGSVIWLLWVLTLQTGPGGMVVALSALLAIVGVIWLQSLFPAGSGIYRMVALALYAAIMALSLPALSRMEADDSHAMTVMEKTGVDTAAFSKEKLDALRAAGKPVFIDATAAWCITCQLNARVAIHTERVMAAFKRQGVTLMIADWTRRNADITEFLSGFGYKGVPLYVFYPANQGQPSVLPQLLSEDTVITAITHQGD